jgi:putative transposase
MISNNSLGDYQRNEHRVHLLNYHFVWTPKRRKPVLVGQVARDCQSLIEQKCLEQGWVILDLAIQSDHIHLFVRIFPSNSPAEVVKECKGITSFHLRKKIPHLKKLPSMWTHSYFVATAGNVSSQAIQQYIQPQKGK